MKSSKKANLSTKLFSVLKILKIMFNRSLFWGQKNLISAIIFQIILIIRD